MSQKLLFKILASSYTRHHEQSSFLEDCLSAVRHKAQSLQNKVKSELKEIREVLSLPSEASENEMSVIMEEETQRSVTQGAGSGFELWMGRIREEFNCQVGRLGKLECQVEKLVDTYKNQLLDISKEMTKWEGKNKELKKEVKKLKDQNNQLKDQLTTEAAKIFMDEGESIDSVFDVKGIGKITESKDEPSRFKIKNSDKSKKPQLKKPTPKPQPADEKPRKPPADQQPAQPPAMRPREPDIIQISIKQKQTEEDLQKWRKLSKKIDELKQKLVLYEEEIEEKNQEIAKLKGQIRDRKLEEGGENQEKRKLKTANTTLRGEKTVLQNQLASLKKQLAQKTQLCNVQDSQLMHLKAQTQSLAQTVKSQNSLLSQLRNSLTQQSQTEVQALQHKINKLTHLNDQLYKFINKQEQELQEIDRKSKEIQEAVDFKLREFGGRVVELESILEEKNQWIVRMKAKGMGMGSQNCNPNVANTPHSQTTYFNELVRVLTKKVADRDEIIRKLEQQQS